jgi:ABC-type transport system substrate-binding protein
MTIKQPIVFLIALTLFRCPTLGQAAESSSSQQPRSGGELVFAVGELPPSFDGHRETTFGMLHPLAPHYSTLLRFDPQNYPKIVGDVAERWSFSRDGLTATFTLRKGIRFHDGTPLTARDVKASYDKIIYPPARVKLPLLWWIRSKRRMTRPWSFVSSTSLRLFWQI